MKTDNLYEFKEVRKSEDRSKDKERSKSRFKDFYVLDEYLLNKKCGCNYHGDYCNICRAVDKNRDRKFLKPPRLNADKAFEYIKHDFYREIFWMIEVLASKARWVDDSYLTRISSDMSFHHYKAFKILEYICIMKFFGGQNFIDETNTFIQEYNMDIKPILLDMYEQIKSHFQMKMQKEKLKDFIQSMLSHSLNAIDTVMKILKVNPLASLSEQMRELCEFKGIPKVDIDFLPKDIEKRFLENLIRNETLPNQFPILDKYLSF